METKEKFKDFVKNNPILLKHVKNESMTWQKFYEMYDMYGEDNEVWKEYLSEDAGKVAAASAGAASSFDLVNFIKNLDLDSIQNGVSSMQRVLGLLQDMSLGNNSSNTNKETYKPRPLYKHFED